MMSATASVVGGVLTVTGDAAINRVEVTHSNLNGGRYFVFDNNRIVANVPDDGVTALDFVNRVGGDTLNNSSGLATVRHETGTVSGGITWAFDYNPVSGVGTLTVTGTGGADRIDLQEVYNNAQYGEPGYGDNRPVGVNILNANDSESQGGPSFAAGSTITIVVNAKDGDDTVRNFTRFDSIQNGGAGPINCSAGRATTSSTATATWSTGCTSRRPRKGCRTTTTCSAAGATTFCTAAWATTSCGATRGTR